MSDPKITKLLDEFEETAALVSNCRREQNYSAVSFYIGQVVGISHRIYARNDEIDSVA